MSKLMTNDTSFRVTLPYKRRLYLVTDEGNVKSSEIQATVKHVMEHLEESVEFKVVAPDKAPKKLRDIIELPVLVFTEDDIVTWQKAGIVRPETLWAAITRKPVYSQPGRGVVPVNPHL